MLLFWFVSITVFAQLDTEDTELTTARNLFLADSLFDHGYYDSALFHINYNLKIYLKNESEYLKEIAENYRLSGRVFHALSQFGQSLANSRKSLNIYRKISGENHPDFAEVLTDISQTKYTEGEPDSAVWYSLKALRIFAGYYGNDHVSMARPNQILGSVYNETGDYDEALKYAFRALAIHQKSDIFPNPALAKNYILIGYIQRSHESHKQALESFQEAKKIFDVYYKGQNHNAMVALYDDIGAAYSDMGLQHKALDYHFRALRMANSLNDQPDFMKMVVYNSIGIDYNRLNDLRKSIKYYKNASVVSNELFGTDNFYNETLKNNIGKAYYDLKMYDSAEVSFREALALQHKFYDKSSSIIAEGNMNLGLTELMLTNYDSAVNHYEKAIFINEQLYGEKHPSLARAYGELGELFIRKGGYSMALANLQKSLYANCQSFSDTISNYSNPEVADCFNEKRLLYSLENKAVALHKLYLETENSRDLFASLDTYMKCDTLIGNLLENHIADEDRVAINEKVAPIYGGALKVSLSVYYLSGESEYLDLAFQFSEKNKANQLLTEVVDLHAKSLADIPDSLLAIEQQIKEEIANLKLQLSNNPKADSTKELQNSLFEANRRKEEFYTEFKTNYSIFFQLKDDMKTHSLIEVSNSLSADEVILSYALEKDSSYVFVVSKEGTTVSALSSKTVINPLLDEYYNAIQNEEPFALLNTAGHRVYEELIAPVIDQISDKKKLIVTNPSLPGIPLEALAIKSEGEYKTDYLIDKFNISYHYSTMLWYSGRTNKKDAVRPELLALAPFSEGDGQTISTRAGHKPLPHSKEEVNNIYGLFKNNGFDATAYFSENATTESALEHISDYSIIHIATHSEADFNDQNLARIHLAECIDQPLDHTKTCLYPVQIYTLPLTAELVVLSSCDSGAGKILDNEGIMSLGRSFINAGASHVISSLWEADDLFSREFMVAFYRELMLEDTANYDESLRKVKQEMKKKRQWRHPKYWGNFIIIGS